jgi:hypothetical protein
MRLAISVLVRTGNILGSFVEHENREHPSSTYSSQVNHTFAAIKWNQADVIVKNNV